MSPAAITNKLISNPYNGNVTPVDIINDETINSYSHNPRNENVLARQSASNKFRKSDFFSKYSEYSKN